ncbi:MAG: hypothetical protein OXG44_10940, partial [Gammaproteobacteria bacterium]|nr:hypothetical protein [Gammaproteobacteria bacterium]
MNVVAMGGVTGEQARLLRERTPANVLDLEAPDRLTDVLSKSRDRITFLVLSGSDGDPSTMETAFREILESRDARSPSAVVVAHFPERFDDVIVRLTSGTQSL